jgi:hypothetical protein
VLARAVLTDRFHGAELPRYFTLLSQIVSVAPIAAPILGGAVLAFASAALFTYIAGSSFVFEDIHGVSASTYSLIFATNAAGMLIAGAIFSRPSPRTRLNTLLITGVATT